MTPEGYGFAVDYWAGRFILPAVSRGICRSGQVIVAWLTLRGWSLSAMLAATVGSVH